MSDTQEIVFEYASDTGRVHLQTGEIARFLENLLSRKKLLIGPYLTEFRNPKPFFLIAGTGLGKTVAVPICLLNRQMQDDRFKALAKDGIVPNNLSPRVWVVEPKIAIAQSLENELNREWREEMIFSENPIPIFGCKTKSDHRNFGAPVMFITTGIFAIYARKGMFESGRDIVLIDEAHVTLESDEAVELGVAICRAQNVEINYMSATVDAEKLTDQLDVRIVRIPGKRFPTWKHNTRKPLEECVVDLVERTLVRCDLSSEYFPKNNEAHRAVLQSVTETYRAKGMLIIVNSFTGERSDANRIARLLKQASFGSSIEIGLLASEVLRNPQRRAQYEKELQRWVREKRRYVLIATSVVEMGVTLPDLDFIVTMDSTFGEADVSTSKLALQPLGVNALIQRIGRVGRTRPGIAYITCEVDASYGRMSDEELNHSATLKPEKIRFPFEMGDLTWIAYHALQQGWYAQGKSDADERQRDGLLIPSRPNAADMSSDVAWNSRYREALMQLLEFDLTGEAELIKEIDSLDPHEADRRWRALKFELTEIGRLMEYWIGRMDLRVAMILHRAYTSGDSLNVIRSFCFSVIQVFPERTLWNPDALERNVPKLAPLKSYERLRKMLPPMIDAVHRADIRKSAGRIRISEYLMWIFDLLEMQEHRFFLMLAYLNELLENFVQIVRSEQEPSPTIEELRRVRSGIKRLLQLRSFS